MLDLRQFFAIQLLLDETATPTAIAESLAMTHDFPLLLYTISERSGPRLLSCLKAGVDAKAGLIGGSTGLAMARKKGYSKIASLFGKE